MQAQEGIFVHCRVLKDDGRGSVLGRPTNAEMARTIGHRGYRIQALRCRLPKSGIGPFLIHISWEANGNRIIRSFSSENAYPTQEKADVHGIAYGQRIIDLKFRVCRWCLSYAVLTPVCWTELLLGSGYLSIAKRVVGAKFYKEVECRAA